MNENFLKNSRDFLKEFTIFTKKVKNFKFDSSNESPTINVHIANMKAIELFVLYWPLSKQKKNKTSIIAEGENTFYLVAFHQKLGNNWKMHKIWLRIIKFFNWK